MKAIVQRVTEGSVTIKNLNYSEKIGNGMVILLGVKINDDADDADFVADKCSNLRIFEDENYKMNRSIKVTDGEVLVISQFTLYGKTAKGNRPDYMDAAKPETAVPLYNKFIERLKQNLGTEKIKQGVFGEMMEVKIVNDGPVTIIVESKSG
jgi:D-tyrosyl-tRNA(Tyr) deacylase